MLVLVGMLTLGSVLGVNEAWADAKDTTTGSFVDLSACETFVGLTNRIAGCIRQTIDTSANIFYNSDSGIYPILKTAITATMTLAVALYGVALIYGLVEKIRRDTLVLLLKIGCVVAFTTSGPWMYQSVTKMMDGAASAAISYTPPNGMADNAGSDFAQAICYNNMLKAQEELNKEKETNKPVVGPWLGMDCLLDTVIGIKVTSGASASTLQKAYNEAMSEDNKGPARALVYLFFSSMQGSILGVILAVIGFAFIYGLLMLIVKAFFTYIAGYLGVTFMVIVSPLFIPLVLFKQTKQYFDKWVKVLISFALQPVIIMTFIAFSLSAMDFAVFSGKYSVMYRIAGDASQKKGFNFNRYLNEYRTESGAVTTSPGPKDTPIIRKVPLTVAQVKAETPAGETITKSGRDEAGLVKGLLWSDCTDEKKKADAKIKEVCESQYPISTWKRTIDWDKMAAARTPAVTISGDAKTKGQQISREVLASLLFCAVVVFILNGLLAVVPLIAYDLLGDYGQSANLGGAMMSKGGAGNNPIAKDFTSKVEGMITKR